MASIPDPRRCAPQVKLIDGKWCWLVEGTLESGPRYRHEPELEAALLTAPLRDAALDVDALEAWARAWAETAERRSATGQNRMIHQNDTWYYLSFRWIDEPESIQASSIKHSAPP